MSAEPSEPVTELLQQWVRGDEKALAKLIPVVYRELRQLAHRQLQSEGREHTLQSAALVNEAFMRFLGSQPAVLQNREHFVAVAARLMRQILVDYARTRGAGKRDAGYRVDIEAAAEIPVKSDAQLLALNDSLEDLSQVDERQARVVEMKFFGGLTSPEIAQVLGVSLTTVERDWAVARLWLRRQMDGTTP